MSKDAGKTVCWHGVEVEADDDAVHVQSRTPCDDPAPFVTPTTKD